MNIDIVYIIILLAVILLSMTLHEAMHAFVGYWLGDNTAKAQGRLTLNPLKHIDPFMTLILPVGLAIAGLPIFGGAKPVPFNPANVRGGEWGAALIAFAGPFTNFIIAFIAFGVWALVGAPITGIWFQIFYTAVLVNLGFCIFNLLPLPPLDGSRVVYALAPEFVRRGMEVMERYGIIVIFAVVLLLSQPLGILLNTITNFFLNVFAHIFLA